LVWFFFFFGFTIYFLMCFCVLFQLQPAGGVLLHGPPGTGTTLFCFCIRSKWKWSKTMAQSGGDSEPASFGNFIKIPFKWLDTGLNLVERGNAAYTRISALLDAQSPVADNGTGQDAPSYDIAWQISQFCYPGSGNPALANIDLTARQGQMLGIVGATGAGKTSLIILLLRYYDDPACDVRVGGLPVSSYRMHALRGMVAVVPQDAFLFTATIAENIALGKPDATMEDIRAVARLAAVEQDILRFPAAYETLVGERGVTLSGGQKQRLSIARALAKEPPILILDDSVSAVDTSTEEKILKNLRTIREGKTTILIAHRISTIKNADKIIVIDEGKVLDIGTHDTLYERCELYHGLVERQRLEDEEEAA
jgi:ABC-type multidrug transport system fused ATPase/permease subunit